MRFFFDTYTEGRKLPDKEGREFSGAEQARTAATEILTRVSKEAVASDTFIEVRSEDESIPAFRVGL